MTWSPGDIDEGIRAILLQIYPILLSTLSSIGSNQLSLFDANFALILTSSPLTVYIVVTSTCEWFGMKTRLYEGIKSNRFVVRILGTSVLFLWFGLSATLKLSIHAFRDSEACQGKTLWDWLRELLMTVLLKSLAPGNQASPVCPVLIFLPAVFIFGKELPQLRDEIHQLPPTSYRLFLGLRTVSRWAWYVAFVVIFHY